MLRVFLPRTYIEREGERGEREGRREIGGERRSLRALLPFTLDTVSSAADYSGGLVRVSGRGQGGQTGVLVLLLWCSLPRTRLPVWLRPWSSVYSAIVCAGTRDRHMFYPFLNLDTVLDWFGYISDDPANVPMCRGMTGGRQFQVPAPLTMHNKIAVRCIQAITNLTRTIKSVCRILILCFNI